MVFFGNHELKQFACCAGVIHGVIKHGTRLHTCPNCFYFILNIGHGWGIVGSRVIPKKERKRKVYCNLASLFSIFNLPHASLVSVSPTCCLFIFLNSLSLIFLLLKKKKNLPFYNKKNSCMPNLFIYFLELCGYLSLLFQFDFYVISC